MSAKAGPFDPSPPRATPQSIEAMIRPGCKSDEGYSANMAVARGLFEFAEDNAVESVQHEFHALRIGSFARLTYWSPALIGIEKRAHVVFFDPRRGGTRLSIAGRRFALSVMHQRARVDDPDLADARLAVVQFSADVRDGVREVTAYFDDEVELYSFAEITEMVEETYEIWGQVLAGREEEARERGTGTAGPLL